MKKLLGILVLGLLWCNISSAKNLSDYIGKKKSAAHYHNCKVTDSDMKKASNYEFGIVYGKGVGTKGDHFVISYDKNTKKYDAPISAMRYLKRKLNNKIYDVMIFFVLSRPGFRDDLGPSIGFNLLISSFVMGNKASLTRGWFNAREYINGSTGKYLFEELDDIINNEDKKMLEKELIKFTDKLYKIAENDLNLSKPFELDDLDKITPATYDWTVYECKTKFAKD